jgi:hypothetical protein
MPSFLACAPRARKLALLRRALIALAALWVASLVWRGLGLVLDLATPIGETRVGAVLFSLTGRSFDQIYHFTLRKPAYFHADGSLQTGPFPTFVPAPGDAVAARLPGAVRDQPPIPHVMWRVWRTDTLPPVFDAIKREWADAEPDYVHTIANDTHCRALAGRFSRRFLWFYDALLLNVMRANMCRLLQFAFRRT